MFSLVVVFLVLGSMVLLGVLLGLVSSDHRAEDRANRLGERFLRDRNLF